jgi:DNA-binding response OmpR family regulator
MTASQHIAEEGGGLAPLTVTQAMVGRTLLTTRTTATALRALPTIAAPSPTVRKKLGGKQIECPCCNQPVSTPTVDVVIDRFGITDREARILRAIWRGGGRPVKTERIYQAMYEDDPSGGPGPEKMYLSFKVALCHIRKKLLNSGISIVTVGYRKGYAIRIGGIGDDDHAD